MYVVARLRAGALADFADREWEVSLISRYIFRGELLRNISHTSAVSVRLCTFQNKVPRQKADTFLTSDTIR